MAEWIDLLDPTHEELKAKLPQTSRSRRSSACSRRRSTRTSPARRSRAHGDYVFGVFLVAVAVPTRTVYYQEIDLVVTHESLLTVRKTPPGEPAVRPDTVTETCRAATTPPGCCAYRLVDEIAERYLDLVDALDDEIDELEDHVEDWPAGRPARGSRSSGTTSCTSAARSRRCATRSARVVDDTIEVDEGEELFPRDVEVAFNAAYDKLLRATDGLELSRDLLAGVRDYHQAKIANDQNEVMKRLTAIASLLLVPTFIVGVYGQNFTTFPSSTGGTATPGRGA